MKQMHVVWLPSWYVMEENPIKGIFFKEQAEILAQSGIKVGMVYPEIRALSEFSLSKGWKNRFQTSFKTENNIPTLRMHGWNLFPKFPKKQMQAWVKWGMHLMDQYIKKEGKPDLIHAQAVLWGGICAEQIAKKYQIPYMITEHFSGMLRFNPLGTDLNHCWSRPYICSAYQNASCVYAVGNALRNKIVDLADEKATVMSPFFDEDLFTLKPNRSPKNVFKYLCVAQLSDVKNYPLLLKAFQKAYRSNPNICLEIAGSGSIRMQLENLSKELGLSAVVTFLGGLSRDEVVKAMHRADGFVLASQFETFGTVLIEALGSGLPVIATRCGGPEDILHAHNGILVPVNNEEALAQALLDLPNRSFDPTLLREDAVARFGKKNVTKKIIQTYQSLIQS